MKRCPRSVFGLVKLILDKKEAKPKWRESIKSNTAVYFMSNGKLIQKKESKRKSAFTKYNKTILKKNIISARLNFKRSFMH